MKSMPQPLSIRPLAVDDLVRVGSILFHAFNDVFTAHGHPPPVPSLQAGISLARAYFEYEAEGGWVALRGTEIVGSAFTHERGTTAGIGPVTVDPACQGQGIGRALMHRLLEVLAECPSVRLFQDAFNRGSYALYASLGFEPRDVMAVLRASRPKFSTLPDGGHVRPMDARDLGEVAVVDAQLTGIVRPADLLFLFDRGPAYVLEDELGGIRGYSLGFRSGDALFLGPVVAPTVAGVMRLAARACLEERGGSVTVRTFGRPGDMMAALLAAGFEVRSLGTYMVRGAYDPPAGVQLSALFPEAL